MKMSWLARAWVGTRIHGDAILSKRWPGYLVDSSYLDLPPLDSLFGKWEIFLRVFLFVLLQGSRGRT